MFVSWTILFSILLCFACLFCVTDWACVWVYVYLCASVLQLLLLLLDCYFAFKCMNHTDDHPSIVANPLLLFVLLCAVATAAVVFVVVLVAVNPNWMSLVLSILFFGYFVCMIWLFTRSMSFCIDGGTSAIGNERKYNRISDKVKTTISIGFVFLTNL